MLPLSRYLTILWLSVLFSTLGIVAVTYLVAWHEVELREPKFENQPGAWHAQALRGAAAHTGTFSPKREGFYPCTGIWVFADRQGAGVFFPFLEYFQDGPTHTRGMADLHEYSPLTGY